MYRKLFFGAFCVLVLSLTLTNMAKADLIAWWRLDDGSGTTAIDSSGSGNDGTLNGGAQWVDGQISGALEFNGSNSYVAAPHIPFDSRSFTIAMWINPVLYTNEQVVFGQVEDGSANLSMHFRIGGPGGANPVLGAVRMGFYSNDLNTAGGLIQDNNWYHLTFWYDFENQVRRIYVDGVQEAEDTGAPYQGTSGETRIGQWNNSQWFQGMIDDVQVYDEALTENEILTAMRGLEGYPFASSPTPADGSLYPDTWVSVNWRAGDFAVSHDVYFGDNFDDVNDGTRDSEVFRVNQDLNTNYYFAGFFGGAYPEGLINGTTYYWRIDEVNDADPNSPWKGKVWSFTVPPKKAYEPVPADNAVFIDAESTILTWTPGFGTRFHSVYFGDDYDTIANATGATSSPLVTYNPESLESDKTYYWRVDESDGLNTYTGDVWSFKTLPEFTITDPNLIGWWKFDEGSGTTTLDYSGHGNHGAVQGDPQWVSGQVGGALEFNGFNSYVSAPHIPLNSQSFTITMWVNPVLYTNEQVVFAQHQDGSTNLSMHYRLGGPNIGSGNVPPRAVRMGFYGNDIDTAGDLIQDNTWYHLTFWYDFENQNRRIYIDGELQAEAASTPYLGESGETRIGQWNNNQWFQGIIDDVRLYNKPLTVEEIVETMRGEPDLAWDPKPANDSTPDVKEALPLTWSPGDFAAQHDVYFGTDRDTVDSANASDTTGVYRIRQSGTNYTPPEGVEWGGGPYFWRIDEFDTDGTISKGRIWSFTVADFLLVDDFEGYDVNKPIWEYWLDGIGYGVAGNPDFFGGNGTGAAVGDESSPSYMEETIVNNGLKSLLINYDNNKQGFANYSETELTLTAPRDWTEEGVANLSLWFRGYPASVGSFVEGPTGTYTMTGSGTDIEGTADEFHFAYKMLSGIGSMVAKVESVENTNNWAKAGVMIRETLEPGSKQAMMVVTPGSGISFQRRAETDNTTSNTTTAGIVAPYWVKIERDIAGNFTASGSADGSTWEMQGVWENIQMGANVYIGFALTSHEAALTCQAVFTNVTTTGNVTGQWTNQDIGILSNDAEPLYVAVSNSTGTPAVVVNDDPVAAQIDTWTEWIIPLSVFADKGIILTDVDKIAIGLGTKDNVTIPGGSGKMFIDDIRLYQPAPAPQPQP